MKELHNNNLSEEKIEEFKSKLKGVDFVNRQLEYSLILLDRLLPNDLEEFVKKYDLYEYAKINDSILRLSSLGLLADITNKSPLIVESDGNISMTPSSLINVKNTNKTYTLTDFGDKFVKILLELPKDVWNDY